MNDKHIRPPALAPFGEPHGYAKSSMAKTHRDYPVNHGGAPQALAHLGSRTSLSDPNVVGHVWGFPRG